MRSGHRGGRSILLKTSGSLRPPGRAGTWIFLDKRPKLRHPTQLVSSRVTVTQVVSARDARRMPAYFSEDHPFWALNGAWYVTSGCPLNCERSQALATRQPKALNGELARDTRGSPGGGLASRRLPRQCSTHRPASLLAPCTFSLRGPQPTVVLRREKGPGTKPAQLRPPPNGSLPWSPPSAHS
jgi:hypothetical protein